MFALVRVEDWGSCSRVSEWRTGVHVQQVCPYKVVGRHEATDNSGTINPFRHAETKTRCECPVGQ